MERGLDLGCLKKFFSAPVQLDFRSVLRHSVLGQNVSGAGRRGAISLGHNFVGQEVSGAGCRGAGRGGAISLGQNVVGQEVSGAGRRGAGRHWGNIPGAERRGAGGQWGRTSWGRTSWGRTSLGQYPWSRRSVGQEVLGQEVVIELHNIKTAGKEFRSTAPILCRVRNLDFKNAQRLYCVYTIPVALRLHSFITFVCRSPAYSQYYYCYYT